MSTGAVIGIIIAIIVILAIAAVTTQELRRAKLRRQFGPEYTRLAAELGSNRKAEAELTARQRRAAKLDIRPLTEEQQAKFASDWTSAQERFVDDPAGAISDAVGLVDRVMRDRGYPAGDDQDAVIAALSVHNARYLDQYRRGRELRDSDSASTEELRAAMLAYRELFSDLVGAPVDGTQFRRTSTATASTNVSRER
jgi:gas vesicle protein